MRRTRRRLIGFVVVVVLLAVAITAKLVDVQATQRSFWLARGEQARGASRTIAADRGDIYDRNGRVLALSVARPNVVADPSQPDGADLATLLGGGFVAPERMAPSWKLLTAWLEELSRASRSVVWDDASFNTLEWELARAGLNSDYSLRSLADRDLGLPLRPLQGQVAGYAKHVHVVETYRALRGAVARAELGAADRAFMDPLMSVLKVAASSPALDVVIVGAE